jgi:hypothetical protein
MLLALLLALLVGLGFANYRFALAAPGGNDFLSRWTAASYWLVKGVNPYDPQVSLAAQMMIYGRPADPAKDGDVGDFVYPLPSMLFFGPFGFFPYPVARAAWMTLLEALLPVLALLGLALARWKAGPGMIVALMGFSVFWYHGFRGIILGNFAVIEAVLIAGALLAVVRGSDVLAGILLALSLCKPQMVVLLFPFVLLWARMDRRWRLLVSTAVATTILIGASVLALPSWPLDWLRQLVHYPGYADLGSPVSIMADAFPAGSTWINLVVSGLLIMYLLWEWVMAMRKSDRWFTWTAMLTLAITNLVAFRTATTNYVDLLPALLLVFGTWVERWDRGGRWAVLMGLLVVGLGLWALFITTVSGNTESPLMYLPMPALTLLGLWWARWWVLRAPRLPAGLAVGLEVT